MPYTVWGAFDSFRTNTVDLNPADSDKARSSRDYLFDQLKGLNGQDADCPKMNTHLPYGSFARKTKIRPLDDIDLLAMLSGSGLSVTQSAWDRYLWQLKISDRNAELAKFDDGNGFVSSIKVLNQIKKTIPKVKNYSKAELKRNQQAVVLNLTSYSWVFDIVPAVPVGSAGDNTQTAYYLIPNGSGNWMRSDPRKDSEYVTRINKKHSGNFLPTLRLLKYWNWRTHKPRLPSYYFETLALKVFDNAATAIASYPDAVRYFFSICPIYLNYPCQDPKGLGPDLDTGIDGDTKRRVGASMREAELAASEASSYESSGNQEMAINAWKKVFGPSFPGYGS